MAGPVKFSGAGKFSASKPTQTSAAKKGVRAARGTPGTGKGGGNIGSGEGGGGGRTEHYNKSHIPD